MKTEAWHKGFESKMAEIKEMGFEAAHTKFNLEYPPGKKWEGSIQGYDYMQGEFEAVFRSRLNSKASLTL